MLCSMATRQQLRAFLDRPWDRLRELKDRHVAEVVARDGADAAFRIAAALRDRAKEAGARQSEQERADDLAAAIRIRRLLDRAGRRYLPRLTADIDVTAEVPAGGPAALLAALEANGFKERFRLR
jgi:hypothetical protein